VLEFALVDRKLSLVAPGEVYFTPA
jgi:hypothetical protein